MSGRPNNFQVVPTRGNRRQGLEGYDASTSTATDRNSVPVMFPRPHFRAGQNSRGGYQVPWLPVDDGRVTGGTWVISRFPEPPISPRNYIHPRPGLYIPESPPRFTAQMRSSSQYLPTQEEESRLNRDEQKMALSKLKKEIYNPNPKKLAKRLSLYYRETAINATSRTSTTFDDEEYEEKCTICLDDFEDKEPIVRTPCNHMFHEGCIVPWVKSHGQCPVCRYAICERMRENLVPPNDNVTSAQIPIDLLIELLRGDFLIG